MISSPSHIRYVLLVVASLSITVPSWAQPRGNEPPASLANTLTGEAKTEYDAAKILLEAGDVENALVKFQRAYDLSKDYRLLWNVAVCENRLRHYRKAQTALVRYREAGGDKLTQEERDTVALLDKTLAQYISKIEIVVNEPNAKVFIDGENVGVSPISEPLRVDVGKHVLRLEKPGFNTVTIERTLAGNSTEKVSVNLEKEIHEGKLFVEAGPRDAILLDGKTVGLGRYEATLPSGGHTLRVTAPGMMAFQNEVLIEDNKSRRITVKLDPLSKQVDMKKWGWVGGGTALAVGGLIAGAFLYKSTPTKGLGTWDNVQTPSGVSP